MGPNLEQMLTLALQGQRESSASLGLSPETIEAIQRGMSENIDNAIAAGYQPIVLCSATVRP
jgi:flagellar biosynthesis component FlhA